ncbi:hypothetical protein LUZ61_012567 [Rhynchospora tenuis]|uniref:BED-type domain-containing protein n=1 Tax=Rhynchospora tenuis TaxID=198213 RepID=A0AAD6A370_9POAL|nr:hypothetical protein LUZ61_012567 [Rhynchospora tenuis]
MGAGLHMETPEEIQKIQDDAQGETQPCPEETINKRKTKETPKAPVWAHFKRGKVQDDGSYTATCIYCGRVYPMGNQRGTGNMRNHIRRGCKKMPPTKRHKADALQKLLQAGRDEAGEATLASWVFDQRKCRKSLAKELLSTTPIKNVLPADDAIFQLRCGCHILNLIVQDGLDEIADEIKKIRDTMKYIRNSQQRMEKFRLAASQVDAPNRKPAWDVETRWNSTYLMLELALQLKEAINRYALSDPNFDVCPDDVDWEHVEALVCHLKIFYDVTNKFSGTKYPTLNIFFPEYCEVYLTIVKMSQSAYPFVVDMSKQMFNKWNKYWKVGSILLAIGCVLDPRCKLDVVQYYFNMMHPEECPKFMDNLRTCLNKLFNDYLLAYSKGSENQPNSSTSHMSSTTSSDGISDTRAGLKSFLSSKRLVDPTKTEMQEYLSDGLDPTSLDAEFDLLAWWKLKAAKYPILSRLARDILAVPISTVASESTFSIAGRILSPIRSSLNDESLEALICAQDWLRASKMVESLEMLYGQVMEHSLLMTQFVAVLSMKHEVV